MDIKISILGLKNAENFSAICREYPDTFYLRAGEFCADPKSMLGVLAIFYSAAGSVVVDTGSMDGETVERFKKDIGQYIEE